MSSLLPFWLQQLVFQLPGLLICAAGFVVAAVLYRRHPAASILTMVGTGLMIATTVTATVIQSSLIRYGMPTGQWMPIVGIVTATGRSIGLALVIVAVFVSRDRY